MQISCVNFDGLDASWCLAESNSCPARPILAGRNIYCGPDLTRRGISRPCRSTFKKICIFFARQTVDEVDAIYAGLGPNTVARSVVDPVESSFPLIRFCRKPRSTIS